MTLPRRLLLPLLALALGLGAWGFWPETLEVRLRRELIELARLSSYGPEESPIAKQRAIGKTKALLSPDVAVQINLQGQPPVRVNGRHQLMEGVQQVRFGLPRLQVEFLDIKIELLPDGLHALASTTLKARIEPQVEYQELKVSFEKNSDGWQISRLETIKTWGR